MSAIDYTKSNEYLMGYQMGLTEGQRNGLKIAVDAIANCTNPAPIMIEYDAEKERLIEIGRATEKAFEQPRPALYWYVQGNGECWDTCVKSIQELLQWAKGE
jgi:hypothetical protein